MPLAFPSKSHGRIAFGFFNIESDMLLLEQLFFFADRFCAAVLELAESKDPLVAEAAIKGWRISDPGKVGNLHFAIDGLDHSGFIGATYRRWPFPRRTEGFKQSPEGMHQQEAVAEMIRPFGKSRSLPLAWNHRTRSIHIAEYAFDEPSFAMLIHYVDRGGYPRWRDESPPSYVQIMMRRLRELGRWQHPPEADETS